MSEQRWSPAQYARDAAFVYESSNDLVVWLDPKPDERILDLGCGTGVHVEAIAARGAHPTGLDGSAAMIDAAKRAYPEREFVVGDGQMLGYEHAFDAVFSNAALHWMTRADDVARGVARTLVPGGRFVFETAEASNVRAVIAAFDGAMHAVTGQHFDTSRWYFPTLGEHATRLERTGFDVAHAYTFARPSFVADVDGTSGLHLWFRLFANDVLEALGDAEPAVIADAERRAQALRVEGGYSLDYVRLRMKATKRS